MSTKPISPDQLLDRETKSIPPDEVFEIFNELIVANWNGTCAIVTQKAVVHTIVEKLNISATKVMSRGYLDIENAYRELGWDVEYNHCVFHFRKA